uniref:Uncharacterized protein n=1 Tax=Penaeus monodon majanivirus A TaxID=2984271 RepID=A0A9C7BLK2_9VIRU|nr:MAG: hypothetical protein [Penaeus monodon majanivirus A]
MLKHFGEYVNSYGRRRAKPNVRVSGKENVRADESCVNVFLYISTENRIHTTVSHQTLAPDNHSTRTRHPTTLLLL